jgi:site-specific DNA-methyltransferase (adenine-specific)
MNDLEDKKININEVKDKKNINKKKLKNIIINEVIIEKDKNTNNENKNVKEKKIKEEKIKDKQNYKKIKEKDIVLELYNDDCLKKLEAFEDNSIDCVITDPPYFIDKLDNNWSSKEIKEDTKNSHIKHLPKGMKFDKEQVKNLYDFYLKVSELLFKKMKPGGYFLSFSSPRLYHSIAMACEIAGFEIRDMINWVYTQSMPKGMSISHVIQKLDKTEKEKEELIKQYEDYKTPMIRSCFEPICVAMKPIKTTFIQNELNFKTGLINFSNKVGENNDKTPANIITTEKINLSYDSNFLVSKPNKKEKGEYNTHITVKPIQMIEHLIKIFSKEKSLVLDPFMGSGTTGISCKTLKRNFIGIELNKEYFDISFKRIENHQD